MTGSRLHLRRRLLLSVLGTVAVTLLVLIGAFNLVLRSRLNHEVNNALVERASAQLASVHIRSGKLGVSEVSDAGVPDIQAWVFAGNRLLEHPRLDPAIQHAARVLISSAQRTRDLPGSQSRLYAMPVSSAGRRLGTVVTATSLASYENSAQTALVASLVFGGIVLAILALTARWLISGALRPVSRMAAQAAAWSDVDSGRRFSLGPPRDELTRLAATLDGLLDRVASSLKHEQRFSAELSHELRSPLAAVFAEAQFVLRHGRTITEHRSGFERVLGAARQMQRTLDTLLAAARTEHRRSPGSGEALSAARAAARGCARVAAEREVSVTVKGPDAPIRIGVETDIAERVLAPLIENACLYSSASVEISVERRNGSVSFTVHDDGPGVPDELRERIFEPGWRAPSGAHENSQGAGLGLPLARRLARAAGGEVASQSCDEGGLFIARLPSG